MSPGVSSGLQCTLVISWWLLGSSRGFIGAPVISLVLLGFALVSWALLVALGCSWDHLCAPVISWVLLGFPDVS